MDFSWLFTMFRFKNDQIPIKPAGIWSHLAIQVPMFLLAMAGNLQGLRAAGKMTVLAPPSLAALTPIQSNPICARVYV